jgi:2-ketocyclohexanecarboxyl-CoA hydrolase
MGLINAIVADADLDAEVDRWCAEIAALSPTAIAIAKKSFNLDSESIRGISAMGMQALTVQLPSCFDVRAPSDRLVSSAPE